MKKGPLSGALCALLFATFALPLGACFWEGGDSVDSPRAQGMAAFITAATDRFSTQGAGAFWDLIVEDLKAECSREEFVEATADEPTPVTFKQLEKVDFDDSRARATIRFVTSEGDRTIEWRLFQLQNGTWRIEGVPGMDDCLE